ncbi:hypothetical protein CVT26_005699 [Gymnopilus dilepis]|uniref:HAM1-like N-terminal domain-containing protein n=1 Tax=Gymnopilus dilepis TaxID=231916 RepID=A0A409WJX7_9AGAR|nr:hypothetical protein CVT26_005699 [Gymnopilus dilepis]
MDYCLSCFGRSKPKDGEREPLLPKYSSRQDASRDLSEAASPTVVETERPAVDKVVDVLAALNAGKLPTQDQISRFLQVLLKSELLKDVEDKGKVIPGYGPLSTQGRKVLADIRALVQAALQFGMEKNTDNKLQELYFAVMQADIPPIDFNSGLSSVYRAHSIALDKASEGTSELLRESPSKDEAAFDAQLFIYALRTLFQSCLSSSVFRLVLSDFLTIAREQFADTAAHIEHAARKVEQTAAELEQRARQGNDIIGKLPSAEGQAEVDASVSVSVDDVKNTGHEVVESLKIAGESAKREWDETGEDVRGKAKERTLERLQQLMTRIQQDRASRSALRAILTLVRKYSERISSASDVVASAIEKTVAQTQEVLQDGPKAEERKPFIDMKSDALLQDTKTFLERVAQGHSLDGVLLALSRVMRDLDEVPTIINVEVYAKVEERSPEPSPEPEPPSALPPPTPTSPETPTTQLSKSQKKKLKKKQRAALAKAREAEGVSAPSPTSPSVPPPEAISPSESQQSEYQVADEASAAVEPEAASKPSAVNTENPLKSYFSRLGDYLDRSFETDWTASDEGKKVLESLVDDGVELSRVAGEAVAEIGHDASEDPGPEQPTPKGRETRTVAQQQKDWEVEMRRKFKTDLRTLVDELEAFIAAVENDKSTMAVVRTFAALEADLTDLIRQEAEKRISAATSWASWLGWAIPRILSLVPSSALPIPSLEVRTSTIEAALRPLYARGVGRTSLLSTSLIPDEVVLKEWTEMRIDMADEEPESHAENDRLQNPDVQSTSRLRMHIDGVRAKLEGMGYYFSYIGSLVGYEDEGVLSVDVGMEGVHKGLEVDFEVEVENGNTERNQPTKVGVPTVPVPEIVVEDADVGQASQSGVKGESNGEVMRADMNGEIMGEIVPAEPLFRVVDVSVATHGLHFKIDQSKHWIINKLLVQPLAGPVVGKLVKSALEDKVKTLLESLAQGLGEVLREARRLGDERRVRVAKQAVQERIGGGPSTQPAQAELDAEMVVVKEEEGLVQLLADWWGALLHSGPSVLGRAGRDLSGGEEETPTRTTLQATSKGLIYTSTSASSPLSSRTPSTNGLVQNQPGATPEMVYHPETKSFERVEGSVSQRNLDDEREESAEDAANEVVIAVGGAQLFPGKAGASTEEGVVDGVKENVRGAADRTSRGIEEGVAVIEHVGERFERRRRSEGSPKPKGNMPGAWQSEAFDF